MAVGTAGAGLGTTTDTGAGDTATASVGTGTASSSGGAVAPRLDGGSDSSGGNRGSGGRRRRPRRRQRERKRSQGMALATSLRPRSPRRPSLRPRSPRRPSLHPRSPRPSPRSSYRANVAFGQTEDVENPEGPDPVNCADSTPDEELTCYRRLDPGCVLPRGDRRAGGAALFHRPGGRRGRQHQQGGRCSSRSLHGGGRGEQRRGVLTRATADSSASMRTTRLASCVWSLARERTRCSGPRTTSSIATGSSCSASTRST